jgi:hypothetical protein
MSTMHLAPVPTRQESAPRHRSVPLRWGPHPWHVRRTVTLVFMLMGLTVALATDCDGWTGVAVALLGNAICIALVWRFITFKRKHRHV